jgi:hypothetical protein
MLASDARNVAKQRKRFKCDVPNIIVPKMITASWFDTHIISTLALWRSSASGKSYNSADADQVDIDISLRIKCEAREEKQEPAIQTEITPECKDGFISPRASTLVHTPPKAPGRADIESPDMRALRLTFQSNLAF